MLRIEYQKKKIAEMLAGGEVASWADLRSSGFSRRAVQSLLDDGILSRPEHNVYRLSEAAPTKFPHWHEIAVKYPNFVVCLLSAAQYHGLTTQMPEQTWVGLPVGSKPRIPTVRGVQWRGNPEDSKTWNEGISEVKDGSRTFKVTSEARTVVDLYRYRDRLPDGERIFAEALEEYDRQGLCRRVLSEIGEQFRIDTDISKILILKGHFEGAKNSY